MHLAIAQQEVRRVYLNGGPGQLVAGVIWLASASLATWCSSGSAIATLVIGGAFIFLGTQLVLKVLGRTASLGRENPLRWLAMQTAFIVPICLPVVGGASLHRLDWFYPGCLVVVGAHYLPFVTLYGLWQFGALGAALVAGGLVLGIWFPLGFAAGGWFGASVLVAAGVWLARAREPDVLGGG
jgi:hypothetical protein